MSFYDDLDREGGLNRDSSGARAPIQILPFLAIGDVATANSAFPIRQKITAVLNFSMKSENKEFANKDKFQVYKEFLYDDSEANEDDDDDDSDESTGFNFTEFSGEIFETLNKLKSDSHKVLVYSNDLSYAVTIAMAYMLRSAHNQEKHLPLSSVIQFVEKKDPSLKAGDYFLHLVVLEEVLFGEISVKLPSNARRNNKSNRAKPSGGHQKRRR